MRILLVLMLLLGVVFCQAQELTDYQEVDKFKVKGLTTKVYFNDPLKHLMAVHPNFDNKENQKKHELLSEFLHNNPLYVFQTTNKKKIVRTYWLTGNPRKTRTKNYFNLEIRNSDNSLDKVIDKVNIGGSFFEHMVFFQSPQGKQSVGKGIQIWGFFTMVQPYSPIKSTIVDLIEQDISNSIPTEIIAKEEKKIEPLFDYQKCGLSKVNGRTLTITVIQYDSLGNIKNQHPRTEKDNQLYYSSTSKDLTGVISFPFFSINDEITTSGNIINVKSKLENINHYLKDIVITNNLNGGIEKIEGKLIIHGYSSKGHSTRDELYLLEFSEVDGCRLPTIAKLCSLNDLEYKQPRLTIEIEYEMK